MKHVYHLILFFTCMAVFGINAQTVTIGAGAVAGTTGSNIGVIYRSSATSAFDFSKQYFLYTAAELSAAGIPPGSIITSVAWNKDNAFGTASGNTTDSWKIYMKNTSTAAAAGWSNSNFGTQSAGATLVYSNPSQVIPLTTGWINLNLSTSFIYTGGSLEIGSDWDCSLFSGGPSTGGYAWKRDNITNACFGGSASTSTITMANQTARPQIQISYVPGVTCSGAPNGGAAASSASSVCPSTPFSLSLTGNTLASGLTYQWQLSTNGTTFTNIAGATNSSFTTSQTVNTSYQCVVTCTSVGLSSTSSPVLVNTNSFVNCYCSSNATSPSYGDISGVTLGNMTTVSGCGITGGPGSINGQYSDYTNTTPPTNVPNLQQGITYPMTVDVISCVGNYNYSTKVWIDLNQNGLFTDPGEEMYAPASATLTPFTANITLNIPFTASTGITRMRVTTVETTNVAAVTPCGTYTWGETEDYFVQISAPLAEDAGINAFVSPTLPTCNFSDSVRVSLKNYGTDTLVSATIIWSKNGSPLPSIAWTGSLAPLASANVTLGLTPLSNGDALLAYATIPNGVVEPASGAWNDSSSIANLASGLTGSYTIGGATPDYTSFAAAASALSTYGTCGPVIFNVRDGIYNEQFSLMDLPSVDAVNTVTFRSENGNASLVTVTYASTGAADNYVIKVNGADHFRFEKITFENTGTTFAYVASFEGGCDSNIIERCILRSPNGGNTGTNASVIYSGGGLDNGNKFLNNTIEGGSYGMYWYGASTTSGEEGTVIQGNHFKSNYFYGMRLYYQNGIVIKNNKIDGAVTYTGTRYALYASNLDKSPQIIGNNIRGAGTSGWSYGIYWFNGGGTPAITGKIENNMVSVGYAGNTSTSYALYMSNVGYMDINHNSLLISSGGTFSRVFYPVSGGANKVKNNIFANYTAGYAIYLGNAFALSECNYNVLYSPAGNIGYYNGNQQTLADWKNASGFDLNGLSNNPMFFSSQDLHVCNDTIGNQGTPIASITKDIDGQLRSTTTPDMGADEFSGLSGSFLGPDVAVCTGDSIMISAGSPTDTILWSTGDTTAFIWVSTPGTYTVIINSACGSGTDAIVVNQSALAYSNYVVSPNLVFCSGDSVLLYGSQMANTYQWSGGSTSTNDSIYATTGGAYTLAITDACGSGSQTVNLTMNTAPTAGFTATSSYLTGAFSNTSSSAGATTYLWAFGDGTTSTQANPNHVYSLSGSYTVTLTVTNACGSNVFTNTILLTVAGLEEITDFGTINVYPNPSTGIFQLEMDVKYAMNLDIVVTNVLGQKLLVKSLNTTNGVHTETIDLSTEAVGVYYLNISSEGNMLSNRVIIKN